LTFLIGYGDEDIHIRLVPILVLAIILIPVISLSRLNY